MKTYTEAEEFCKKSLYVTSALIRRIMKHYYKKKHNTEILLNQNTDNLQFKKLKSFTHYHIMMTHARAINFCL